MFDLFEKRAAQARARLGSLDLRQPEVVHMVQGRVIPEPPPEPVDPPPPPPVVIPAKPSRVVVENQMSDAAIKEYHEVASKIGLGVPELLVERFKQFLIATDLPSYNLKEVVAYMDALAERDSAYKWGWQWVPLREADKRSISFGTRARHRSEGDAKASDLYGPNNGWWATYEKIVPLHALRRVALVEEQFGVGNIAFAVSDYATEPHIRPDPFLMAMVPNPRIAEGVGRFVIDVWDEPGFGIEQMLK